MNELTVLLRGALTEEELALLAHSDLDAGAEAEPSDDLGDAATAGFRERLLLGDLSW